ncbi:MAG: 30S ribosomal protein S4 [Candidatus Woesearchaeota archaeon]
MGDPRKLRKQYSSPKKMWTTSRIDEEKELTNEYGLRNKREIWKARAILSKILRQAKQIIARRTAQSEKEKDQLLAKLKSLSLIPADGDINAVLNVKLKDLLGRRLQTIVFKKNLANTINQARQFVSHRHINIGSKNITVPSYLVRKDEEEHVSFKPVSALAKADHPERAVKEKKEKKVKKVPHGERRTFREAAGKQKRRY